MATVNESIEVNAPLSVVYNQWTQFEEFPNFMEGVKSVTQVGDTRLRWVAEIAGEEKEWEAKITEQTPDSVIAWTAIEEWGPSGRATFQSTGEGTRVDLEMTYEPEGLKEKLGSALGLDSGQVKADLERFKELIESRGVESGAWRGEVHQGQAESGSSSGTI